MYDITNRETFDNLDKWIYGVRESMGNEKEKYIINTIENEIFEVNYNNLLEK